ncbi:cation efflux protein, partial [Caulochytrium protostelioides]
GLCFAFFCVELVAGIWSGSLAILSDSFHLLSDIAGFGISLTALYLSSQPATDRHSFGFHRAEIIGAVVSTFLIWVLTAGLLYEAVNRLRDPQPIDGKIMFITAAIGVGGHGHDDEGATAATPLITNPAPKILNINVHSAAIHVIGDLLSSIGVLISAGIIWYDPTKTMVDPICTFIFSIFVVLTTVRLMSNSFSVLMEGTPAHIDPAAVLQDLRAVPGVTDVHDLHIWSMTVGQVALVAHAVTPTVGESFSADVYNEVLLKCREIVCVKYAIHHSTIQIDVGPDDHCNPRMCRR